MPASAVPRARLLRRVAAADSQGRGVTLVSAPAGSGKTMLLAQCWTMVRSDGAASAWLALGDDDNDPFVLWSGVLCACERAVRGVDPLAEVRLGALSPPAAGGVHGFVAALFEALDSLPRPLWIFLDDVHHISSADSLAGLAELIKSRPERVRVVLGSRFDPQFSLARMILTGEAWELRASDLAFDRAEAAQLLSGHEVPLEESDLDLLMERTEGWAVGLRMAALSLAGKDDVSKYLAGFAGDDRPLADYLVAEVLTVLPDDVVELLITTSVAETLTPDLAARLSGRHDAGGVLDQLARDNALVYRVGGTPASFRLHGLLRSFLSAEGNRRDTGAQRRYHVRASAWFEDHDHPVMALDHAADGTDWPRVAELVDRYGVRLLLAGEASILLRTVRQLRDELVSRPATALLAALAALDSGALESATYYNDLVGRRPEQHRDRGLRLLHVTALMSEARSAGDRSPRASELVSLSEQAAPVSPELKALAAVHRGVLRLWLTDYPRAEADLEAALHLARQDGYDAVAVECLSYLTACAEATGDFAAVQRRTTAAVELATARGWAHTARMAPAYVAAAHAAWQRLENDVAAMYLSQASVIDGGVEPEVGESLRLLEALLACDGAGSQHEALRHVRLSWSSDDLRLLPGSASTFCLSELRMAISLGDDAAAADVLARVERLLGESGDALVMRALLQGQHGRRTAALNSLARVTSGAAVCHSVNSHVAGSLLAAHLAVEMNEPARAHEAIVQALALAAPRQLLREFAAASAGVRSMLMHNEGRFAEYEEFVSQVLAARSMNLATVYGETLTSRELDLLRDLPSRLSLEEIAAAHVLSVNTVKTHLKSVYRKFHVGNRRQAVDRARELGLL